MLKFNSRLFSSIAATAPTKTSLAWNDYFKLRLSRNRTRPLFGIPSFLLGTGYIVAFVPFSPVDPIVGVDPAFVYGFGSIMAGAACYQIGAGAGQVAWRVFHRANISAIDRMDKVFYGKISAYRAERGQSPYVQTTGNLLSKMKRTDDMSLRQDFYGEKVRSVADYRMWLRRQRKLTKEQLGPDSKPIRGA